jgi:hypothetical protein
MEEVPSGGLAPVKTFSIGQSCLVDFKNMFRELDYVVELTLTFDAGKPVSYFMHLVQVQPVFPKGTSNNFLTLHTRVFQHVLVDLCVVRVLIADRSWFVVEVKPMVVDDMSRQFDSIPEFDHAHSAHMLSYTNLDVRQILGFIVYVAVWLFLTLVVLVVSSFILLLLRLIFMFLLKIHILFLNWLRGHLGW